MLTLIKYVSLIQLIRQIANLYLHTDELYRSIIVVFINANRSIVINPTQLTVHEAFIQPFLTFRFSNTLQVTHIAVDGFLFGGTMNSGIMFADIIGQLAV